MRASTACPSDAKSRASEIDASRIAEMSAPAQKALSPAPVMISARTSGSASTLSSASRMPSSISRDNALSASGRSSVTNPTGPLLVEVNGHVDLLGRHIDPPSASPSACGRSPGTAPDPVGPRPDPNGPADPPADTGESGQYTPTPFFDSAPARDRSHMQTTLKKSTDPMSVAADAIVVFVPQPPALVGPARRCGRGADGLGGRLHRRRRDHRRDRADAVIHTGGLIGAARLIVVGHRRGQRRRLASAGRAAGASSTADQGTTWPLAPDDARRRARQRADRGRRLRRYRFDRYKSAPGTGRRRTADLLLGVTPRPSCAARAASPTPRRRRAISPTPPQTTSPRQPSPRARPSSPTERGTRPARCSSARTCKSSRPAPSCPSPRDRPSLPS